MCKVEVAVHTATILLCLGTMFLSRMDHDTQEMI